MAVTFCFDWLWEGGSGYCWLRSVRCDGMFKVTGQEGGRAQHSLRLAGDPVGGFIFVSCAWHAINVSCMEGIKRNANL